MKGNSLLFYALVLALATSFVFAGVAQVNGKSDVGSGLEDTALGPLSQNPIITIVEAEGPVVAITSWDTNQVMLKTNYFYGKGPAPLNEVLYIMPVLTGFTNVNETYPYGPRACFDMKYYDAEKNEIPALGSNDICISTGDSGMVIEALKVTTAQPIGGPVQGRVLMTAPLVP